MDNFNPVDYTLIDIEKYFSLKGKRQLDYISSTGCFFRCTFCADPFVFNRSFTAISPNKMLDELIPLCQKHQIEDINFQDETFFTYPKRIAQIAQGLIKK